MLIRYKMPSQQLQQQVYLHNQYQPPQLQALNSQQPQQTQPPHKVQYYSQLNENIDQSKFYYPNTSLHKSAGEQRLINRVTQDELNPSRDYGAASTLNNTATRNKKLQMSFKQQRESYQSKLRSSEQGKRKKLRMRKLDATAKIHNINELMKQAQINSDILHNQR